MTLILGVDGGGTKTEVVLAEWHAALPPRELARGTAGPSNPQIASFELAAAEIAKAVRQARAAAHVQEREIAAACCCVAGAGREADQQRMLAALEARETFRQVRFIHDGWAALAAAWDEPVGMALVAGTGSLAFGRHAEGATARVGGWGPVFGDEGSAYDLAVRALRAVARAADDRGPPTDLTEKVLAQLGIPAPDHLIAAVYGGRLDRRMIASLAPAVFAAAMHDSLAAQLVADTADQLADHVVTLAKRLALPREHVRLAMTGGMLIGQTALCDEVAERCSARGVSLVETRRVCRPVDGALRLAAALLAER